MSLAGMSPAMVSCPRCGADQDGARYNGGEEFPCGGCGTELGVEVFPAFYRPNGVHRGEALTVEGEAGCFYHPRKKAAAICAACGRFLCSLCETELAGRCLCPSCIDKGRQNQELEALVTRRTLYDSVALSVAILPLLFFPLTVITAPIVIFIAVRFWKRPGSILPRTRLRFVAAILIALLQIGGWVALVVNMV